MSKDELTQQLLALPLSERVDLAQALWQSIGEEFSPNAPQEEREAIEQARKRDRDLATGKVNGRSHEQVMEAAHRALQCG